LSETIEKNSQMCVNIQNLAAVHIKLYCRIYK